jgi:membrane associated rhomboid family serine protease
LNRVLWWAMKGQLAWQTHLGGFLAGAAAAWVLGRNEH